MLNEITPRISGKIAVATNDNVLVAGHVGRCKAFLIYETEGSKIISKEIRQNSFTHHGQNQDHAERHHLQYGVGHGHGHQNLVEGLKDCESLIFNHGGWRLIEDLKAHNLKPILTNEEVAENAVLKYLNGNLVISEDNVCRSHQQ
jgi:predicted Fe-Mo cluster-binding NifX family protein